MGVGAKYLRFLLAVTEVIHLAVITHPSRVGGGENR